MYHPRSGRNLRVISWGADHVPPPRPSYSPNLNLIERLWKLLRKHALQQWHATSEAMRQNDATATHPLCLVMPISPSKTKNGLPITSVGSPMSLMARHDS